MSETEATFLDLGTNLDDVPDLVTVAGGEHEMRIIDLGITVTEKGKFLIPRLEIMNNPLAKEVSAPLRIPDETMNEKDKNRRMRNLKAFYKCFGINTAGPVQFNEQIGKTGWVTLDESEDAKYGKQNNVRQWLIKR